VCDRPITPRPTSDHSDRPVLRSVGRRSDSVGFVCARRPPQTNELGPLQSCANTALDCVAGQTKPNCATRWLIQSGACQLIACDVSRVPRSNCPGLRLWTLAAFRSHSNEFTWPSLAASHGPRSRLAACSQPLGHTVCTCQLIYVNLKYGYRKMS